MPSGNYKYNFDKQLKRDKNFSDGLGQDGPGDFLDS